MVISTQPLIDLCPIQPAAMEGRQMVQWDKDSCADAGFLKIDLLGLGMLSAVERCVEEIARTRSERIDLSRIDFADKEVYARIQEAETMGVFQIESRAQMSMLPRTLPESLDDITVQVALVRPGPIQGGAVHPYIERKKALREDPGYQVPYEHPSLEPVLRDTLGAIVFQDQVIEVAMAFAGFSAGEAEGLRRAMSRKRSEEAMRSYEQSFVEGAVERGATREVAQRVYDQIVGFSGFGFPKSHSAAFGLLAYQSTWLRVHYGPEFLCALLNEQPMGFYPPDSLVHEAQRRQIEVRPPCVAASDAECRVEPGGAVRIGLGYVNGVKETEVKALVAERERGGRFRSIPDLGARSGAAGDTLGKLAWAGACDALLAGPEEGRRRQALWLLGVAAPGVPLGRNGAHGTQLALPLDLHDAPELRRLDVWERMLADYGSTGVTLREHPLELTAPEPPGGRRLERRPGADAPRSAGAGGGARGGPPAAGHSEGGHLHAAGGRARHAQPDRAPARARALPPGRARRGAGDRRRPPRAPRGSHQRARPRRAPPGPRRPAAGRGAPHRATADLVERGGGGAAGGGGRRGRRLGRRASAADLAAALPAPNSFGRGRR